MGASDMLVQRQNIIKCNLGAVSMRDLPAWGVAANIGTMPTMVMRINMKACIRERFGKTLIARRMLGQPMANMNDALWFTGSRQVSIGQSAAIVQPQDVNGLKRHFCI